MARHDVIPSELGNTTVEAEWCVEMCARIERGVAASDAYAMNHSLAQVAPVIRIRNLQSYQLPNPLALLASSSSGIQIPAVAGDSRHHLKGKIRREEGWNRKKKGAQ